MIRHDLNFLFQYLAFYTVDVFDYLSYPIEIALTINLWSLSFCLLIFVLGIHYSLILVFTMYSQTSRCLILLTKEIEIVTSLLLTALIQLY